MRIVERFHINMRIIFLAILDALLIHMASMMSLWMRFDFLFSEIDPIFLENYLKIAMGYTLIAILIFVLARLYRSVWTLASMREIIYIFLAAVLATISQYALVRVSHGYMPRSYYFINMALLFMAVTALRFSIRIGRVLYNYIYKVCNSREQENVMIIGAGDEALSIIREYQTREKLHGRVCCAIDDNRSKKGKFIGGVPIVGNRYDLLDNIHRYAIDKIIITVPKLEANHQKEILEICQMTKCEILIVPEMYQLLNGEVSTTKLRNIEIEDLLGRDPIRVNLEEIKDTIKGKGILITGGGGSIGSELCRQIAAKEPKQLIIFDICENYAYDVQNELKQTYPELDLVVLIGSVRNAHRIHEVMETYKPDVVFHAAAHKHVPLMEVSPNEAIKNNVFGTLNTATAAGKNGVQKFVLISTDKAVNPTNIMGASKRICEMVIQALNQKYATDYVAVRFGNVLGSNGSVVPLFKRQIEQGGPVTVTHPDIIRYFMTIPEAVSLVLQAATFAKGGEIFVLDMGEPVKIDTLARNLIRLSGYIPDEEIKIEYTGLRPGEKLYEELLMDEEGLTKTTNKLIFIGKPIHISNEFFEQLEQLKFACYEDHESIKELVHQIVPTYTYTKIGQDRLNARQEELNRKKQEQENREFIGPKQLIQDVI